MKGATCYEYQFGRVYIRILRPRMHFVPYKRWNGDWVLPTIISVKLL